MAAKSARRLVGDLLLFPRRNMSLNAVSRPESISHCSSLMERATFETGTRALTFQKTLEHLRSSVTSVDKSKVKSVSINDKFSGRGTDGASLFLYERIPQIKFHNPDIPISCSSDPLKPFEIEIIFENETSIMVPTEDRNSNDIYSEFCKLVTKSNDKIK